MRRFTANRLEQFKALKIKPVNGFAQLAHLATLILLPFAALFLVRADITILAFLLVILSKWRVFAVRPRFWLANIRTNAIDVVFGLATVIFIIDASSLSWQLAWAVIYVIWLVAVKPGSTTWLIGLQAFVGEIYGLVALYIAWGGAPVFLISIVAGVICYLAARHFFEAFSETYSKLLAYLWATFAAAVVWLMGHLLFFYGPFNQPTVLLAATSFGAATLYYLDHFDRSSKLARRQIALLIVVVVLVIFAKLVPLMFYVWSDKVL